MNTPIPQNNWKLVARLIDDARARLENGEALAPMAYVGSFTANLCVPIQLKASSTEHKDNSAMAIKRAAESMDADYILMLLEAWTLRKDKLTQMDAIMKMYGSIGASPYAVDVVSVSLETRYGVWLAEVPIIPKGISKKKRTIGTLEFRHFTEAGGRFINLLPAKLGAATLH
jgi:hypothetical protein